MSPFYRELSPGIRPPPPPPPPARSLEAILKTSVTGGGRTSISGGVVAVGLGLVVGFYGPPLTGADAAKYGNVWLPGASQYTKIPKLKGSVDGAYGQPAYVLSSPTRQLLLGTVAT